MSFAMTRDLPALSVIVPVRDDAANLASVLEALEASDMPRSQWELIVVDDASSDDSPVVAARHADAVVRLPGASRGAAYARNRGAEMARSELVLFLGADIRVKPDSLRHLVERMERDSELAAVSAVAVPEQSASLAAQYRSGHARFTGERSPSDALTISPECGVVRRSAFMQAGMWDEWRIHQPRTEAAELASRLRVLGHRLTIDRSVEVECLRRWDAASVLAADLRDPELYLLPVPSAAGGPTSLRARLRQGADILTLSLLVLSIVILVAAVLADDVRLFAASATLMVTALATEAAFYALLFRRRGIAVALSVVPLHLASSLAGGISAVFAWLRQHAVGDPRPHPAVEAFAEIGIDSWPPVPRRRSPQLERPR